jgi:hypothetical protein
MKKEMVLAAVFYLAAIYFINVVIFETNGFMIVFDLFIICVFMVFGSISIIMITVEQLTKSDYESGYSKSNFTDKKTGRIS